MDFLSKHCVPPGHRVDLGSIETNHKGPFKDKQEGEAFTAEMNVKIRNLQYRMFVERKQSLLIVLQAPDAAGKDGLIRHVLGKMNPQGCRTYPFKTPSEEELSHDFLWRIHQCTPAKGMVSIFNRSHYEDVLVVRVKQLVPKKIWSKRYDLINSFEENLALAGTRILKFYLHISPEEQLERFEKRLENEEKHWKLNVGDYAARDDWPAYNEAYEEAIHRCNSDRAPWFIIPADRKWYRDASVAGIVYETLREMDPQLPKVDVDLDEVRALYARELAELNEKKKD
ncbi:MAG: polyphosphate kinase 2 family protein [Planctomycetes bacterium]|nr:polyphosphate kinase 2 family protein [Planctomycetota bacterium]